MMNKYCILLLITLTLHFSCTPSTIERETDHDELIAQIENGLLPTIAIEGEESPVWTIQERMNNYNVPGLSITYFDKGEIQWARAYGYLTKDSMDQVDHETLFQAASISKPVAAMAAMTLVEEGLLDMDAPVNQYLDGWQLPENEFTAGNPIDFRNLVTHTGGLTVHGFRGYAEGEEVPTTIQILDGAAPANSDAIVADTFPEVIWRYSGGGYTVAQKVMTDITGQPFHEIMAERVLERAGMLRSTFEQPLPEAFHENAAVGYRGNGEPVAGRWHTYPEQAAAGLWTNPSDLARMAISVQRAYGGETGQIVSPDMAREVLTKHLGDWGLGFGLSGEADSLRFGHGGANEGYRCNLFAFANRGPGVAIMTNGDRGGALYGEVLRAISKAYQLNAFQQEIRKVRALTGEQLSKFEGEYVYLPNPEFSISIELEDGALMLHQKWNELTYPILPDGPLTFFDKGEGNPFAFIEAEEGDISKVVVNGNFELLKVEE